MVIKTTQNFTPKPKNAKNFPTKLLKAKKYAKLYFVFYATNLQKFWQIIFSQGTSQSTYIYRAPQYMSPRWNWDSPTPLAASECALPAYQRVGGHTRLRLKGWGSPNSNDWRNA
jgi:hypothetical protein